MKSTVGPLFLRRGRTASANGTNLGYGACSTPHVEGYAGNSAHMAILKRHAEAGLCEGKQLHQHFWRQKCYFVVSLTIAAAETIDVNQIVIHSKCELRDAPVTECSILFRQT